MERMNGEGKGKGEREFKGGFKPLFDSSGEGGGSKGKG